MLSTAKDLALVLIGFGLIIFLHELGHYLAARWAGIRVLAFALGFGPALFSWRKGLGFRRGSTEREMHKLLQAASDDAPPGPKRDAARAKLKGQTGAGAGAAAGAPGVSPTEYRFNILPLGGYVKMLGQDDADPSARSDAPDSYQNCKPLKRMVVISAGVIFNVITAAIIFIIVFTAGLKTEAPIIGLVATDSPAAKAPLQTSQGQIAQGNKAQDGKDAEPADERAGLRPGDEVLQIDGEPVHSFKDITLATAMAAKGRAIDLTVRRRLDDGASSELTFRVVPKEDEGSRLLAIGVSPAANTTLLGDGRQAEFPPAVKAAFERLGLKDVKPGDRLEAVEGRGEEGTKGSGDRGIEGAGDRGSKGAGDQGIKGAGDQGIKGAGETASAPLATRDSRPATLTSTLYTHLDAAAQRSEGRPIAVRIIPAPAVASTASAALPAPRVVAVTPRAELQSEVYDIPSPGGASSSVRRKGTIEHILGLAAPMGVQAVSDRGEASGLKPGDVFALLGDVQWPTQSEGILEIRKRAGRTIPVKVWRAGPAGPRFVTLDNVKVHPEGNGTIGFTPAPANLGEGLSADAGAFPFAGVVTAAWPQNAPADFSGVNLKIPAGSIITAVNDAPVATMTQLREALRAEAKKAAESVKVVLTVRGMTKDGSPEPEAAARKIEWTLNSVELKALKKLGWRFPLSPGDFELVQTTLRADGLLGAIGMGLHETKNAMTMTYITFARLFQGTVKVEHLRGPVGIAHAGTLIADKGLIWLLFFMGIISINLAVVNFLPLPIVDGGHFLFLLYEQITGKPVSVAVQNITTIAGLGLIVVIFLVVTYHDVMRLIGLG